MNSKIKGNIALGNSIQYATLKGYIVSLPLNDAQDYDIIFDIDGKLNKIQVKYTSTTQKSGNYYVDTRTKGHGYIKENIEDVDYYFVTTANNINYFIPYNLIKENQTFTLNDKFKEYIV